MDGLLEIAAEHDLAIVEDAAHAPSAKYKGRAIGSSFNVQTLQPSNLLTAFSFYATKNLTTGEGGMLTGPPDLIEKARVWSLHGMSRDAWKRYSAKGSWYYEVVLPGFKCNMTDIQASLGIHQLRKLPRFQARRREIAVRYTEAFEGLTEIETPTERPEVEHAWHIYAIRLNLERLTIDRGRFIEELKARKIGTSVHFIPIHLHPYYRDKYGYEPEDFPVAYGAYQRLVSLPIYPRMTEGDVGDVVEAVADVVEAYRR
jgi:dTDP-4-amino-4,6-dideoxygalactose transaminase